MPKMKMPVQTMEGKFDIEESEEDTLIPIRLDLEVEGRKIKEHFCWNVNEP